jgi:hypothetical protein
MPVRLTPVALAARTVATYSGSGIENTEPYQPRPYV